MSRKSHNPDELSGEANLNPAAQKACSARIEMHPETARLCASLLFALLAAACLLPRIRWK